MHLQKEKSMRKKNCRFKIQGWLLTCNEQEIAHACLLNFWCQAENELYSFFFTRKSNLQPFENKTKNYKNKLIHDWLLIYDEIAQACLLNFWC